MFMYKKTYSLLCEYLIQLMSKLEAENCEKYQGAVIRDDITERNETETLPWDFNPLLLLIKKNHQ